MISKSRLTNIDFICTYGKDFEIASENLHGNNTLRYSELAVKNDKVAKSLRILIVHQYIEIQSSSKGFYYKITESGRNICNSLNDGYAERYQLFAKNVIEKYNTMSDRQLEELINRFAVSLIKEAHDE
jgi:hypothetical protein